MGIRDDTVKQYKKSKKKFNKELKALKNHNKILYSIANKYGSRSEIKKIKNIQRKASKKVRNSSSGSSSDGSYSDSSLARNRS